MILIVSEIIIVIKELLNEHLGHKINESNLLIPDNYGKFSVSIDDMIPDVNELLLYHIICINLFNITSF